MITRIVPLWRRKVSCRGRVADEAECGRTHCTSVDGEGVIVALEVLSCLQNCPPCRRHLIHDTQNGYGVCGTLPQCRVGGVGGFAAQGAGSSRPVGPRVRRWLDLRTLAARPRRSLRRASSSACVPVLWRWCARERISRVPGGRPMWPARTSGLGVGPRQQLANLATPAAEPTKASYPQRSKPPLTCSGDTPSQRHRSG